MHASQDLNVSIKQILKNDKPIVLVTSCQREIGIAEMAITGNTYIDAVRVAGARPLLIPAAETEDLIPYLNVADGIFLTGSPSNIHPSLYGQEAQSDELRFDPVRDALSLPLIRAALDHGVPLFAICRGCQEFNVALGGSLHQAVHELPGHIDHRPANEETMEGKFGPSHEVDLLPGGMLEGWLGENTWKVNSSHRQGIDKLAPGLRAEAFAPGGLVEAITLPDASGFNLGVQWHPEWKANDWDLSRIMLGKFGEACRDRQRQKGC